MEEVTALLTAALSQRPQMQVQDAVKLLYQRTFGPEHLVNAPADVLPALLEEWNSCQGNNLAPVESLGNGVCRVNLAPVKAMGLAPETLCHLLKRCADAVKGSKGDFDAALNCVKQFSFPNSDVSAYLEGYRNVGCPPVHHSSQYRAAYHPAYRLALEREARFLPLFAYLDRELPRHDREHPLFLAIDGRAAAGKSTLADLLKALYGALVLHMDDYFLPPKRKTAERLAVPGGNVDWERFLAEALSPLAKGEPAALLRYDCHADIFLPPQPLERKSLIVAEGVYSLHPALRDAFACKVFLSLTPDEQQTRILARSGEAMAKRFREEWVPLEEAYFSACGVEGLCSFFFD
ncbi:MAG: hypothetical protein HFF09_00395 [Oscillospiraceae bacterium]|nr:hypothetical protein [Oscillospiraceae bacterium]